MTGDWLLRFDDALSALPAAPERGWVQLLTAGTMRSGLYAPRGVDDQTPHAQDEIYVVARGSGSVLRGAERRPFAAGDLIFVPAGMDHRFVDFTADFAAWVVFWGPPGGEEPARDA